MGAATDLSGRFIKFEVGTTANPYTMEFEVVSGSVSHSVEHQTYLPVGRTVMNVITHGHTIIYNFQGVLLVRQLPWSEYDTSGTVTDARLTPGTALINLYVTLNRDGTSTSDSYYDEAFHYSANAQVLSMEHAFDTGNHQAFNVQIIADGSYDAPQSSS